MGIKHEPYLYPPSDPHPLFPPGPGEMYHHQGIPPSSSSTLYPTAAPPDTQPGLMPPRQNEPNVVNGTPKPSKAATNQNAAQASGSTPGASASTPAAAATPTSVTMTPVVQPASLKRKAPPSAADVVSPTEPPKRAPRKRNKTQNGS